jgi:hypothetical protein
MEEGPIDNDGILLGFVVGGILTLGLMLGVETGCNDLDGCNEELLDGLVLSVGLSLLCSLGKSDTVGGALAFNDGRNDTDGPCDGGVVMLTDGSVLTSMGLTLGVSIGDCEYDGSELIVGW